MQVSFLFAYSNHICHFPSLSAAPSQAPAPAPTCKGGVDARKWEGRQEESAFSTEVQVAMEGLWHGRAVMDVLGCVAHQRGSRGAAVALAQVGCGSVI